MADKTVKTLLVTWKGRLPTNKWNGKEVFGVTRSDMVLDLRLIIQPFHFVLKVKYNEIK